MSRNLINGRDANPDNLHPEPTLMKDLHFIWFVRTFSEPGPGIAYTTRAEALIDARMRVTSAPMNFAYELAVETPYAGDHMKITKRVHANQRYEHGPQDIEISVCKVPLREKR